MPVKDFISVGGEIIYEVDYTNPSGDILTYGRDALGNVVAGYDAATSAVFTFQYKPYGDILTSTGSVSNRRFLWAGTWGYRYTTGSAVSQYIRARHLSSRMGMWNSIDPLWPNEMPYIYVNGQVTVIVDPSGENPVYSCDPQQRSNIWTDLDNFTGDGKRPCYGGRFTFCMCDAALEGDSVGKDLRRKSPPSGMKGLPGNKDNAIAHCITACIIQVKCGSPGADEWQSREFNPYCSTPWHKRECEKDRWNNSLGFGIGKGIRDPKQRAAKCAAGCLDLYGKGRLDLY